jgi:hypothetical protein
MSLFIHQTVIRLLIEEKSKHVNLGYENGFGSTKLHSLQWLGKGIEKSVLNMI